MALQKIGDDETQEIWLTFCKMHRFLKYHLPPFLLTTDVCYIDFAKMILLRKR